MKIVFIIASFEGFGGTNRVATLLANNLSVYYEITILSRYCTTNTYILDNTVTDIKFKGNNFKFINQCKRYIEQDNPDIVIVHTMSKLTPALLLVGIKAKKIWSLEHISYKFHSTVFKNLRRYFYKKVDKVITLTEADALNYQNFHPTVVTIANPTPLSLRTCTNTNTYSPSKTIVSIGRLTDQKGFDQLIEAWVLVKQKHPNWSLDIYGEGEDKEKLEQIISNYGLGNVSLKGVTDNVQKVYDSADFYVMSSRFEGFGMVLIEAQSRGLPIVSFDCPSGPAEIVTHDVNGYLVENGNIEMLAERIIYLIDHVSIREFFSANAVISAKRFEPEQIIKQWVTLIDNECR